MNTIKLFVKNTCDHIKKASDNFIDDVKYDPVTYATIGASLLAIGFFTHVAIKHVLKK